MKVRLEVTVEIDPAKWQDEYRIPLSEVRVDVWNYFEAYVYAAPAIEATDAVVAVR